MDVLIAIAIFIIILAVFISVGTDIFTERESLDLEGEGRRFLEGVSSVREEKDPLLEGSELDEESLVELATAEDYDDLKRELGISSDFCIYFEDETGELFRIDENTSGIGSEYALVSGGSC